MLQHEPLENEPRYDAETLRKVTALASELKTRHQETLSAGEIESIGAEVGLEPRFMAQALAQVTQPESTVRTASVEHAGFPPEVRFRLKAVAKAWWAAGWTLPIMMGTLVGMRGEPPPIFFLGWALYIGVGILLSTLSKSPEELADEDRPRGGSRRRQRWHAEGPQAMAPGSQTTAAPQPGRQISRADLLDALFAIQQALEQHKQHRAFLSLDVVNSTSMKAGVDPLVVEHSFGQFRAWVEGIIRAHGGEMQSAAGDGMMCVFPDEASALRSAREMQGSIEGFNGARNRLGVPFRIRCGITAGTVALEPGTPIGHLNSPVLDRAATLQKRAEPGDIVVGGEVAAAALVELGGVAVLPELVNGERAFSWKAAGQRA